MYTLKNLLRGEVIDVLQSPKSGRIHLVIDASDSMPGGPHFLLPLLCPNCGQPWHFIWNDAPEKLLEELKKVLVGYLLVQVKYYPKSSTRNISNTMAKLSLGSVPAELLIENAAEHPDEDEIFPAATLLFESHVPSEFPQPEELRAMTAQEVRELLDLDETEDVEEAILGVEEWMAEDDYEDYDVDDDILLAVHPSSILDAILVEPEYLPEAGKDNIFPDNLVYPYLDRLKSVEDPDADRT